MPILLQELCDGDSSSHFAFHVSTDKLHDDTRTASDESGSDAVKARRNGNSPDITAVFAIPHREISDDDVEECISQFGCVLAKCEC